MGGPFSCNYALNAIFLPITTPATSPSPCRDARLVLSTARLSTHRTGEFAAAGPGAGRTNRHAQAFAAWARRWDSERWLGRVQPPRQTRIDRCAVA